ncbi:hypothetical protein ACFC26_16660 [Kitasatospora purpeofusca]|uniref:hypothetical protein n=1 Tax=Kitasatospora purpeofusca TaxID=67352 RepID=UPI0035D733E4
MDGYRAGAALSEETTVFRDPTRKDRPGPPTWEENLREFEVPVAILDGPESGRRVLVGRHAVNEFLNQLDVAYYDDDRTIAVQVTTHRPLPGHFRTTSDLDPALLLDVFLANASPDGPVEVPREQAHGAGHLIVDGRIVPADRISRGDYTVTSAALAGTTLAVVSTADLHGRAVRLRRATVHPLARVPQL